MYRAFACADYDFHVLLQCGSGLLWYDINLCYVHAVKMLGFLWKDSTIHGINSVNSDFITTAKINWWFAELIQTDTSEFALLWLQDQQPSHWPFSFFETSP